MNQCLKSTIIWIMMIPLAIINGVVREFILNEYLGEKLALPISGILLSLAIFILSFLLVPRLKGINKKTTYYIGLYWMFLTLFFEYGMTIFMQKDLETFWSIFNPLTGNLWVIVWGVTGVSPLLAVKIRGI